MGHVVDDGCVPAFSGRAVDFFARNDARPTSSLRAFAYTKDAGLGPFGVADDPRFVQFLGRDNRRPTYIFRAGKAALAVCPNLAPLLRRIVFVGQRPQLFGGGANSLQPKRHRSENMIAFNATPSLPLASRSRLRISSASTFAAPRSSSRL
ncbi:hypothetical protein [Mesorhizobium muleiense]|uniref:hypothetical protein n=1 Tax=Mesorhizobium muleiense TaxID=1004279 RepID=UPI001F40619A|nr:hypothetical protein [Mesorhizobium muleiense]MCF6110808.1 hypothetical protein [Mesorhizobium muleiense]